ncbi:expressed unknown protein [Seminavis robusta]|uniref:Uncharacterized protein n=1 Tax=Seminavis robusta TaxID=568900 RepID=A0A9N8EHP8_9STRA|nr:expressed unknown protein [Seminavis robusta]|eukprot:Sro1097_g240910.1 n/a (200) ;mRNA; r:34819-35418
MDSFDLDDMAEARAMADEQGYHQRSPSMMIVVPLQEGGDRLFCDDLNASFYEYDFYLHAQEDYDDGLDIPPVAEIRIESPKSIVDQFWGEGDLLLEGAAPKKVHHARTSSRSTCTQTTCCSSVLPIITDLIQSSTTISAARRSCHRRSRNRAMAAQDFHRNILPKLDEALEEYELDGSNSNPLAANERIGAGEPQSAEC